jgi:hypothetical protein
MLLANGEVNAIGKSDEIVHRYLGHSELKALNQIEKRSSAITLHWLCIKDQYGNVRQSLSWTEDFWIEIGHTVHEEREWLAIGIVLIGEDGYPVLTTSTRSSPSTKELPKGTSVSRVRVPAKFLSPTHYSVFVNAHSITELFVEAENVVTFCVLDEGREILGREGQMKWPGVVCPILTWTNEPEPSPVKKDMRYA